MFDYTKTLSGKAFAIFAFVSLVAVLSTTSLFAQDWTPGCINVKFYDQYLPIEIDDRTGYVVTNLTWLNDLSSEYGLVSMVRIFGSVDPKLTGWFGLDFEDTSAVATEEILNDINNRIEVITAEPNYILEFYDPPDDPNYDLQWAHDKIRSAETWADGEGQVGNPAVIVAIIDSGVDWLHEDLRGSNWINTFEDDGDGVFDPEDDAGEKRGVDDGAPGNFNEDDDDDGFADLDDLQVINADYDQDGMLLCGHDDDIDSFYDEFNVLQIVEWDPDEQDGDDPEDLEMMVDDDDENG